MMDFEEVRKEGLFSAQNDRSFGVCVCRCVRISSTHGLGCMCVSLYVYVGRICEDRWSVGFQDSGDTFLHVLNLSSIRRRRTVSIKDVPRRHPPRGEVWRGGSENTYQKPMLFHRFWQPPSPALSGGPCLLPGMLFYEISTPKNQCFSMLFHAFHAFPCFSMLSYAFP